MILPERRAGDRPDDAGWVRSQLDLIGIGMLDVETVHKRLRLRGWDAEAFDLFDAIDAHRDIERMRRGADAECIDESYVGAAGNQDDRRDRLLEQREADLDRYVARLTRRMAATA